MSVEEALIAQARPYMLSAKIQALLREEIGKGCSQDISPVPVALEPTYHPLRWSQDALAREAESHAILETPPSADDVVRLHVWLSPHEPFDWNRTELFLRQVSSISHRIGLEVVGNQNEILISLLCHRQDEAVVTAAFHGHLGKYELTPLKHHPLTGVPPRAWDTVRFHDYYPPPPYSHLLTRPDGLHVSPYETLIATIATIPPPAVALYQVLCQPVCSTHNWHHNVQVVQDLEYSLKLVGDLQSPQRYAQQAPSGNLRQMSWEMEEKAHNDKPFYSAALRILLVNANDSTAQALIPLATVSNLFRHGGRPLNALTESDYAPLLPPNRIREMFLLGLTYHPGFLVNSSELTGLFHPPPAQVLISRQFPIETLGTLPAQDRILEKGTYIGVLLYAGQKTQVHIPPALRKRHTHIIGRPGMGKSSTEENMILNDCKSGAGVAVLDPHGDLVERLLYLIPEDCVERTIYFNPGEPDWVPIWNPLLLLPGQDPGRIADDLVGAVKSVVTGWGDRLEHLLRNSFFALLQIPGSTLLDVANLLRSRSEESKRLRREILEIIDNESAKQFWENDFARYSNADLSPPKHKLSKLLLSGTVSLMLSQPESRFNFRHIMDSGLILLANLSTVGSETRAILGSFLLSLFHLTALQRQDTPPERRKPFHIYCDEAHLFVTEAMEDLIAETRKFNVSLTLAHQFLSQFDQKKVDALSNVGSTIIFNVDTKDARYLIKDLRERAQVEDVIALEVGEAIARIGTEVVQIKTPRPIPIPKLHQRDRIINESRARYYRPASEVREAIRQRYGSNHFQPAKDVSLASESHAATGTIEEFSYDEFAT